MEALLIDEWLRDLEAIPVIDEASLSVIRTRAREAAEAAGAAAETGDRASLVATELGRNQLRHARAGWIAIVPLARGEHRGVEIVAADRGPGLAEVAAALDAAPRAAGSLGVGIGSVRRMSFEVDFDVRLGEGTCVRARVLPQDAPRRREVGVYGRAHPGEAISGDGACVVRAGDGLFLAVCDGLGHGPPAREATGAAVDAFRPSALDGPGSLLETCHRAIAGTRGVVMGVVRIDEEGASLETACIGNVDVQVVSPRRVRRFGCTSTVLGAKSAAPLKVRSETAALTRGDLVVLSTDGIASRPAIEGDLALLREHPIAVAQRIVERHGRGNDDALVLVAR